MPEQLNEARPLRWEKQCGIHPFDDSDATVRAVKAALGADGVTLQPRECPLRAAERVSAEAA